jgi:hypothetical protein
MQTLGLEKCWWPQRIDEDAYKCTLIPFKKCQKYWYNILVLYRRKVQRAPAHTSHPGYASHSHITRH